MKTVIWQIRGVAVKLSAMSNAQVSFRSIERFLGKTWMLPPKNSAGEIA